MSMISGSLAFETSRPNLNSLQSSICNLSVLSVFYQNERHIFLLDTVRHRNKHKSHTNTHTHTNGPLCTLCPGVITRVYNYCV